MMGAMQTNVADAFKTGMNMEGYQKMNAIFEAIQTPYCDLEEAATFCTAMTYGKGTSIINGACIAMDHGWTSTVG